MRKYPPAGSLVRIVTKEYHWTEAKISFGEGQTILIPVHGIHHDADIYDQPDEFRPERFTPDEIAKRPNMSFLPFGDGPRNCIGMRFGMMETRIALIKLLQHFRFNTCSRTPPMPMKFSEKKMVLTPVDGVTLNVQIVN